MTAEQRHERPAQIAAGLLRPCLLAHLMGTSAYGYELHHRMLAIGLECDLGTVYRALNTMEDEGLLRSTWEMSQGGRSRRRYELNEVGGDVAEAYVPVVEQLVRVAHAFLDGRRSAAGTPPDPEGRAGPRGRAPAVGDTAAGHREGAGDEVAAALTGHAQGGPRGAGAAEPPAEGRRHVAGPAPA